MIDGHWQVHCTQRCNIDGIYWTPYSFPLLHEFESLLVEVLYLVGM